MPNAGEKVRASDVTDPFARKTATETVTSSTTLQDDDELFVSVEANSVYMVEALLCYDGATAGDFKFAFTLPSGATLNYGHMGTATTIAAATGNTVDNRQIIETDTLAAGAAGAGTILALPIWGILIISSTAGTMRLQWAQFASSATPTRMFAPSFLHLRKVA